MCICFVNMNDEFAQELVIQSTSASHVAVEMANQSKRRIQRHTRSMGKSLEWSFACEFEARFYLGRMSKHNDVKVNETREQHS